MKDINQILDFIVEIEKLKGVLRKSRPVGLKRYENSAEHSWHVCISALMLKDYANNVIDIDRVLKMLLIHDLCEIDAGDQIVYSNVTIDRKMEERRGIKRILDMLPNDMGDEYLLLWEEFESGSTEDSKYAKAIDRVPPLLHNINDDGHGWKKNKIKKENVFTLNSERISTGSAQLWEAVEEKLLDAVKSGALA